MRQAKFNSMNYTRKYAVYIYHLIAHETKLLKTLLFLLQHGYNDHMMHRTPIITLLTDFGTDDHYVSVMKGVILRIIPRATIIDITHDIPPHDIRAASDLLARTYRYFPARTIHVCVIDPGVGSQRKPIALKTPAGTFLAPDNGLLTEVAASEEHLALISLNPQLYSQSNQSFTFHGRDVFAPAAALLAKGVRFNRLGNSIQKITALAGVGLVKEGSSRLHGTVIRHDHFGNIITRIGPFTWQDDKLIYQKDNTLITADPADVKVICGNVIIQGILRYYSAAPDNTPFTLIDSDGFIEISINRGNACREMKVAPGDMISVCLAEVDEQSLDNQSS